MIRYTYKVASGQGLRFDIFNGLRRIAITHDEADAKMIVSALNAAQGEKK